MKITLLVAALSALVSSQAPACSNNAAPPVEVNVYLDGNMISQQGSVLANQRASAKAFFDGYKAWNIDAILAYRTPDCLHQVLPASLNRTAQTNADVTAYFKRIENTFANFTPTVINEVHDTTQHFAIVHAKSTAMTKIGQYTNEYALTFRFTDDGKKVKHIEEFIDSKYTLDFNARLAAAP